MPEWRFAKNVVAEGGWADRQWIAAAGPSQVAVAWMGGASQQDRQVAVTHSRDHGNKSTWTEVEYLGEDIGWLGLIAFDPNGTTLYVPFTQPEATALPDPTGALRNTYHVLLAKGTSLHALDDVPPEESRNKRKETELHMTREVLDTGVVLTNSHSGLQWSGTVMAPAFDVTGDGHLVYAWSQEIPDPAAVVQLGSEVRYIASADAGRTWSVPGKLSTGSNAIMPWVTGAAGDRFAVVYYESLLPLDSDYVGRWDVVANVVDGAGAPQARAVRSVIEAAVHTGGICGRGGLCLRTASDRSLLDFFEADVTAEGDLVVVYPKDTGVSVPNALLLNVLEVKFAIQNGGTPLLVRAP